MNIRRAVEKDLAVIDELLDQVDLIHHEGRPDLFRRGRKYDDEQLTALFRNDLRPIYVAVDDDDRPMGYAFCMFVEHPGSPILTNIRTMYVDDLCVYEHLRGRGIGYALYEHVLRVAKENGCYNVTLNVWACNPEAKKFYEKCGMVPQKYGMETILK